MAGTRLFPNHQRTPSLRGALTRYYSQGQWRVRAWPRKRGTPKSLKVRNQNNWFRDAVQLAKRLPATYIADSKQVALDTGLYPKDPLMSAMAGNLYEIVLEDGTVIPKWVPKVHPTMFTGARLELNVNQTIPAVTSHPVAWEKVPLDIAGFFDPTVPTRLTIPTGVNVVELNFNYWMGAGSNSVSAAWIDLSGAGATVRLDFAAQGTLIGGVASGPIAVAPGLFFEAFLFTNIARTLSALLATNFTVNVLDAD